jgi:hypothetical protein
MANSDNIGGLVETNNPQIAANGLFIPSNINTGPSPNKLLTLFNANSDKIYTKFSYFSDGGRGTGQPFITTNPNSYKNNLPSTQGFPLGNALQDTIRITRFSKSVPGLIFALKQVRLQGLQPFNETKIYNPLMPIQAAAFPGSLGLLDRPIRHIEPTLSGVFGALGLSTITNLFTTKANPTPPKGTVGERALPINAPGGAKGLTRGASTSTPYKNLTSYWGEPPSRSGILNTVGNFFKSNTLFGAFSAVGQPKGTKYKADESTYDLMIVNSTITDKPKTSFGTTFKIPFSDASPGKSARFYYVDTKGAEHYGVSQKWHNPTVKVNNSYTSVGGIVESKLKAGYQIPITDGNYTKTIFKQNSTNAEQSQVLSQYEDYINAGKGVYPTKLDNNSDPFVQNYLNQLIENLPSYYSSNPNQVVSYVSAIHNWNDLNKQKSVRSDGTGTTSTPVLNVPGTYLNKFENVSRKQLIDDPKDGKGFAGSGQYDVINVLNVSDKTNLDLFKDRDLIKFWFYDITNKKYIPFRATVKGISERYTSNWDEFQYIGNADKVYNYKGFTRALGFNFTAVAMSLKELLPMWTRINYLLSLSKPAKDMDGSYIVPPLVQLTIGDLYKNQPIVINGLTMTIPENAIWETIDESKDTDYNYYNGRITSDKLSVAQFPYEAEINVECNILEKETPVTGRSNFGESDTKFFSDKLNVNESVQQQRQEIQRQQEQDIQRQEMQLQQLLLDESLL